jgi:hypothetical protein
MEEYDDNMLLIDGFDSAMTGVSLVWHPNGSRVERAVYSGEMIVDILIEQGMTEEEALEYCDFNIEGAYMGESTPIIFWDHRLV